MRGPSLQKTVALSFAIHLTVFVLSFLLLRKATHIAMPVPYTVNLVSPQTLQQFIEKEDNAHNEKPVTVTAPEKKPSVAAEEARKDLWESVKEHESIEKKISLMAAKKRMEQRFNARTVISLKGKKDDKSVATKTSIAKNSAAVHAESSPVRGSTVSEDYYSKITDEIRQQWVYPNLGKKDIEAVVSVRILRDGTAIVQKVEKSSGNSMFDRSALRALSKSSPLPPPPYEMEIGVRFYP